MSHLYKTRLKKFSSTEFNENWLDSWEYLEERLEFFLEFSGENMHLTIISRC